MDREVYDAAFVKNIALVEDLLTKGASKDMALMGSYDGKHPWWWLFERGACLIWVLEPQREHSIEVFRYGKKLSMLQGPGEVSRGTFLKKE